MSRSSEISEKFSRGFDLPADITKELFSAIDLNSGIGIFKQNSDLVLKWIKSQEVVLQDELLLRGLIGAIANVRAHKKYGSNGYASRRIKEKIKHQIRVSKARQFDRIVEMLDHEKVGDKVLGDCTKADLLRAAVAAEQSAGKMTLQAGFYRLLADLLEPGVTVRKSNRRGEVVALLTHTFKEAE